MDVTQKMVECQRFFTFAAEFDDVVEQLLSLPDMDMEAKTWNAPLRSIGGKDRQTLGGCLCLCSDRFFLMLLSLGKV